MGTIQPSRFLSHTGRVLPGVRRVVQVPNPAAGADWSVTVPGGVQWRVLSGTMTFTASATVQQRISKLVIDVDGVAVMELKGFMSATASQVQSRDIVTDPAVSIWESDYGNGYVALPSLYLPQGATASTSTFGIEMGDQWSGVSLWVEEVYFTDAQLSEIARTRADLDHEIAQYEYGQAMQGHGKQ